MKGLSADEEKLVLEIISNTAPDCDVIAFGSRVAGTNKTYSDLDLAFALPNQERLPFCRLGEIKEAFSESDLLFRVDVTDYNAAGQYFKDIIDKSGQKLQAPCPMPRAY